MGFLKKFDKESDPKKKNKILRDYIEYKRDKLFKQLKKDRPILEFWSYHPGNPDLADPAEGEYGTAYMLSSWEDVNHALKNFSMKPYARPPLGEGATFALSMDDEVPHEEKRNILIDALKDPKIVIKIEESVNEAWQQFSGHIKTTDHFDVSEFARTVALKFTGKYFGIPETAIFHGEDNLAKWSGQAYENFIWKIHARHFGDPNPDMQGALSKIAGLILKVAPYQRDDTVIRRMFMARSETFNEKDILANIIGLIQGLIDNVATGSCYALNQMYKTPKRLDNALSLRYDLVKLKQYMHDMHKKDTPSPFLPRRGKPIELPSVQRWINDCENEDKDINEVWPYGDPNKEVNFACAIGAAIKQYTPREGDDEDQWDIRMGKGPHQCIGRYLGDEIMVRIIAKVLSLGKPDVCSPLYKKWGWIVQSFQIKSKRKQSFLSINHFTSITQHRPHPYSLWHNQDRPKNEISDYTSWASLTDCSFFSRHLPPGEEQCPDWPSTDIVKSLFKRSEFKGSRSSLVFAFFAQWLTDSFLRTKRDDRRKNTSNHQIDMCQIYGLNEEDTNYLRAKRDGKLLTSTIQDKNGNKCEYPPLLFNNGEVKDQFKNISHVKNERYLDFIGDSKDSDKIKENYFATGLERGNSTIGYTALSTLFIREHNRICDVLKSTYCWTDDERLFQTARLIVIALELKIVIEEYINHITSDNERKRVFTFDQSFAEKQDWYRQNWISVEFDLLYRWHSLIPESISVDGACHAVEEIKTNNELLLVHGVERVLDDFSGQAAGRIGLLNTPDFLLPAEEAAIKMARDSKLRNYNDYREVFGLKRIGNFSEISSDEKVTTMLNEIYGSNVDNCEFLAGLYAEENPKKDRLFGELMTNMVAYDAFTHALSNPILSKNVWGPQTLTEAGMKIVDDTRCLDDLLKRNASADCLRLKPITMDFKTTFS